MLKRNEELSTRADFIAAESVAILQEEGTEQLESFLQGREGILKTNEKATKCAFDYRCNREHADVFGFHVVGEA